MDRILLCCNAGMSTSMVVQKMLAAAKLKNIDVEINAVGSESFATEIANYNCCMLGPQIKYKLKDFQAIGDKLNKPVVVINSIDYGMLNGEKILDAALKLIHG